MAAESDASSGFAGWAQLYQQSLQDSTPDALFEGALDSTVVSTTSSPAVVVAAGPVSPGRIEGRVGKPTRRKSRASRRSPTTLLNTSTTNFRAMVQQFTGIASAAGGGPFIDFARIGANGQLGRPVPVPSYQLQQQQQYTSQEQEFTLGGNNNARVSMEAADVGRFWDDVAGHVMMPAQQHSTGYLV